MMNVMNGGAVVLLSGGMDSAYCLHWAKREFERVYAVFVDYGQRNVEFEGLAARRIAAKAEVALSMYQMRVSWNATLCALSRPLRSGTDEDGLSHAFVPGRNLHLLTIAAAHTREGNVDADTIVIGCCANDAAAFPDCRPSFLRAAGSALGLAMAKRLLVIAPLVLSSKVEMLRGARKDPRTWDAVQGSWSCYTPAKSGAPCGQCDACGHRVRAFTTVMMEEPPIVPVGKL
jgi:7-cyano-7-deazaguanine synthase